MPERTTLAETLAHVFAVLEQNCVQSSAQPGSLLQAWTAVLGGNGRSPLDVVQGIGQISAIMIKVQNQIKVSTKLKDVQKKSARQTLDGFLPVFQVERFHEHSSQFLNSCSETNRGNLGLIGISLESEFSEPKLEKPDAAELVKALKEIQTLLADSTIFLDLRLSLTKHINVMIWWLEHPELASLQDVFETVGSALVLATQMKDRDPQYDASELPASKNVYERVVAVANKLGTLVGLVHRGIEAADMISGDVHRLVQIGGPPST